MIILPEGGNYACKFNDLDNPVDPTRHLVARPRLCVSGGSPGHDADLVQMAGTWYGGSPDAKYMLTIIQNPDGGYTMIGQAGFTQANLGYPVTTAFSNSIVKIRGNKGEFFGTGMVNKSAAFPAPEPELWALHGVATLATCSTLKLDYDFFGAYLMPTDKKPFIDTPDYVVVPPPFSETYQKMPVTCKQCPTVR